MRVFIAIEVNDEIKAELSNLQNTVREAAGSGKFTSVENFHLTVHYIGEVNSDECERAKEAIEKTAKKTVPFQLSLSMLGSFKKKNREIIWVGVNGQLDVLHQLNKDVLKTLSSHELIDSEINYVPHLTLGRQIKLDTPFDDLKERVVVSQSVIPVDFLTLMESKRVNGKLVYEPIYRIGLSG